MARKADQLRLSGHFEVSGDSGLHVDALFQRAAALALDHVPAHRHVRVSGNGRSGDLGNARRVTIEALGRAAPGFAPRLATKIAASPELRELEVIGPVPEGSDVLKLLLGKVPSIVALQLRSVDLSSKRELSGLIGGLISRQESPLQVLEVVNCQLRLPRQLERARLRRLVVRQTDLRMQGRRLVQLLVHCSHSLEVLDLSRTQLPGHVVRQLRADTLPKLRELDLSSNPGIPEAEWSTLCASVAVSPPLEQLRLEGWRPTVQTCRWLGLALRCNSSLRELRLSHAIGDQCALAIVDGLTLRRGPRLRFPSNEALMADAGAADMQRRLGEVEFPPLPVNFAAVAGAGSLNVSAVSHLPLVHQCLLQGWAVQGGHSRLEATTGAEAAQAVRELAERSKSRIAERESSQFRATAAHWAAHMGKVEVLRELLEAAPELLDAPDRRFQASPLHWAIRAEQVEAARFLIAEGASRDLCDVLGRSAADLVSEHCLDEVFLDAAAATPEVKVQWVLERMRPLLNEMSSRVYKHLYTGWMHALMDRPVAETRATSIAPWLAAVDLWGMEEGRQSVRQGLHWRAALDLAWTGLGLVERPEWRQLGSLPEPSDASTQVDKIIALMNMAAHSAHVGMLGVAGTVVAPAGPAGEAALRELERAATRLTRHRTTLALRVDASAAGHRRAVDPDEEQAPPPWADPLDRFRPPQPLVVDLADNAIDDATFMALARGVRRGLRAGSAQFSNAPAEDDGAFTQELERAAQLLARWLRFRVGSNRISRFPASLRVWWSQGPEAPSVFGSMADLLNQQVRRAFPPPGQVPDEGIPAYWAQWEGTQVAPQQVRLMVVGFGGNGKTQLLNALQAYLPKADVAHWPEDPLFGIQDGAKGVTKVAGSLLTKAAVAETQEAAKVLRLIDAGHGGRTVGVDQRCLTLVDFQRGEPGHRDLSYRSLGRFFTGGGYRQWLRVPAERVVQVAVMDFAGQAVFYAGHRVLLSGRAGVVQCVRLCSKSEKYWRDGMPLPTPPSDAELRSHARWVLQVHHATSVRGDALPPPILLVGTHMDSVWTCPGCRMPKVSSEVDRIDPKLLAAMDQVRGSRSKRPPVVDGDAQVLEAQRRMRVVLREIEAARRTLGVEISAAQRATHSHQAGAADEAPPAVAAVEAVILVRTLPDHLAHVDAADDAVIVTQKKRAQPSFVELAPARQPAEGKPRCRCFVGDDESALFSWAVWGEPSKIDPKPSRHLVRLATHAAPCLLRFCRGIRSFGAPDTAAPGSLAVALVADKTAAAEEPEEEAEEEEEAAAAAAGAGAPVANSPLSPPLVRGALTLEDDAKAEFMLEAGCPLAYARVARRLRSRQAQMDDELGQGGSGGGGDADRHQGASATEAIGSQLFEEAEWQVGFVRFLRFAEACRDEFMVDSRRATVRYESQAMDLARYLESMGIVVLSKPPMQSGGQAAVEAETVVVLRPSLLLDAVKGLVRHQWFLTVNGRDVPVVASLEGRDDAGCPKVTWVADGPASGGDAHETLQEKIERLLRQHGATDNVDVEGLVTFLQEGYLSLQELERRWSKPTWLGSGHSRGNWSSHAVLRDDDPTAASGQQLLKKDDVRDALIRLLSQMGLLAELPPAAEAAAGVAAADAGAGAGAGAGDDAGADADGIDLEIGPSAEAGVMLVVPCVAQSYPDDEVLLQGWTPNPFSSDRLGGGARQPAGGDDEALLVNPLQNCVDIVSWCSVPPEATQFANWVPRNMQSEIGRRISELAVEHAHRSSKLLELVIQSVEEAAREQESSVLEWQVPLLEAAEPVLRGGEPVMAVRRDTSLVEGKGLGHPLTRRDAAAPVMTLASAVQALVDFKDRHGLPLVQRSAAAPRRGDEALELEPKPDRQTQHGPKLRLDRLRRHLPACVLSPAAAELCRPGPGRSPQLRDGWLSAAVDLGRQQHSTTEAGADLVREVPKCDDGDPATSLPLAELANNGLSLADLVPVECMAMPVEVPELSEEEAEVAGAAYQRLEAVVWQLWEQVQGMARMPPPSTGAPRLWLWVRQQSDALTQRDPKLHSCLNWCILSLVSFCTSARVHASTWFEAAQSPFQRLTSMAIRLLPAGELAELLAGALARTIAEAIKESVADVGAEVLPQVAQGVLVAEGGGWVVQGAQRMMRWLRGRSWRHTAHSASPALLAMSAPFGGRVDEAIADACRLLLVLRPVAILSLIHQLEEHSESAADPSARRVRRGRVRDAGRWVWAKLRRLVVKQASAASGLAVGGGAEAELAAQDPAEVWHHAAQGNPARLAGVVLAARLLCGIVDLHHKAGAEPVGSVGEQEQFLRAELKLPDAEWPANDEGALPCISVKALLTQCLEMGANG